MWKKTTHFVLLILLMTSVASVFLFSTSVLTNNNIKNVYDNSINVNDLRSSNPDITIVTPENKSYSNPMNGYYPATFGFENDQIGTVPSDWIESADSSCTSRVIQEKLGHKKVVHMRDDVNGGKARLTNTFLDQEYGTIELWYLPEDATVWFSFRLVDTDLSQVRLEINVKDDKWHYSDGSTLHEISNVPVPQNNVWQHVKIEFECRSGGGYHGLSQYTFKTFIDGISSGNLPFQVNGGGIDKLYISSLSAGTADSWIDAVGYSWDPSYFIGDNLNAGLLLSFDTTFTPDWLGYSLDGQGTKTILGSTTIPSPSGEGMHTIQVFGNNSIGTMYQSDIRYFTIGSSPTILPGLSVIIIIVLASVGGAVLVFVSYFVYNKTKTRLLPRENKPKQAKIKKEKPSAESLIFNCPFCQAELTGRLRFCVYCGAKLEE